ncbi:hypothetical protein LguiA_013085 [Lonicera macranthoides]
MNGTPDKHEVPRLFFSSAQMVIVEMQVQSETIHSIRTLELQGAGFSGGPGVMFKRKLITSMLPMPFLVALLDVKALCKLWLKKATPRSRIINGKTDKAVDGSGSRCLVTMSQRDERALRERKRRANTENFWVKVALMMMDQERRNQELLLITSRIKRGCSDELRSKNQETKN